MPIFKKANWVWYVMLYIFQRCARPLSSHNLNENDDFKRAINACLQNCAWIAMEAMEATLTTNANFNFTHIFVHGYKFIKWRIEWRSLAISGTSGRTEPENVCPQSVGWTRSESPTTFSRAHAPLLQRLFQSFGPFDSRPITDGPQTSIVPRSLFFLRLRQKLVW